MTPNRLAFVAFEPRNGEFEALLSMEGLFSNTRDPQLLLKDAAAVYDASVKKMRFVVGEIEGCRAERRLVPARRVWEVGNAVFELRDGLARLCLQLNDVYGHLVRDLGVNRKWLEKAVIFRRYLPDEHVIPDSLNWGRCEKGTRRAAERLSKGLPVV